MREGERQVAPTLDGIRADHVARYRWAAAQLPPGTRIVDCGCGVGYGAAVLADAGHWVLAFDLDAEAIDYAVQHYARPQRVVWEIAAAERAPLPDWAIEGSGSDAAVAFEILEHLSDPGKLLRGLRYSAEVLLCSVPNEKVFPFAGTRFHHRHYTRGELEVLLAACGWRIEEWWGQAGHESDVEPGVEGRTLVVRARRVELPENELTQERAGDQVAAASARAEAKADPRPRRVAILGLGPSLEAYVDLAKRRGGRGAVADEIWGINALGDVLCCDLLFHMDDIRIQQLRAEADPDSNIARMVGWLKTYPGRVLTSQPHPDFPCLEAYPLEAVINACGYAYFNSTAAYAVAYAIWRGVKEIALFGIDFTWPDSHKAEKGRACVEFWLGQAAARGIKFAIAQSSTLWDAREPAERRLYGYDAVQVEIEHLGDGSARVQLRPRETLPSAAEIEARYDHSAPTAPEEPSATVA